MTTYIDPLTGRVITGMPQGYDPRFAGMTPVELDAVARNARPPGLFSLSPDPVPAGARSVLTDNAAAPAFIADAQREQRNRHYAAQPASPRQFLGPGDGAPMFEDNPMAPAGALAPPPPPPTPPPPAPALSPAMDMTPPGDGPSAGQPANATPAALPLPVPPPQAPPPPAAPQGALAGPLMAPPVRPDMSRDDVDAFATRLMPAESGGRPDVVNSGGYAGLFQFGAPRLQSLGFYTPGQGENIRGWGAGGGRERAAGAWSGTFNIPGFENVRTLDDFLRNPDAQRAAFRAHIMDIDQTIDSIPGAETFDRNGLRAVAHLGGNGGLRRFVESGGQFSPADGNGTTLQSYYQRFAGTDAPMGLQGRQGRPMPGGAAPAAATDATKPDALPANSPTSLPTDATSSPNFYGAPAQALLAAGSAMMGAPNMMQGFGRAGQAFVQQANTDRAFEKGRLDRAEARADRRADRQENRAVRQQSAQELAAYRRAQLELQNRRLDQAGQRAGSNPNRLVANFVDQSGQLIEQRFNQATNTTEYVLQGQNTPLTPEEMAGRSLTRIDQTGAGRRNGETGVDNQNNAQAMVERGSTARETIAQLQRIRTGITTEGGMGPDLVSQTQRFLADRLRLPTGSVTPQGLALNRQQIDSFVSTVLPELVRELRPVSNIDAETVRRALLSVNTEQDAMRVMLDIFEAPLQRQARMSQDWLSLPGQARSAIVAGGPQSVEAWQMGRRQVYDSEGFFPNPRFEPRQGGGLQIRPGETIQRNGITIQRVE